MEPSADYPSTLAFTYPFTSLIEATMLFYPLDGYYLTERQFEALRAALCVVPDKTYYLSTYEDEAAFLESPTVRGDPRHYLLDHSDSYEDYRTAVPWPLEYAMYARSGAWGAIVGHEGHCVIGGDNNFVTAIRENYPNWREDVLAFSQFWGDRPDSQWANQLVSKCKEG